MYTVANQHRTRNRPLSLDKEPSPVLSPVLSRDAYNSAYYASRGSSYVIEKSKTDVFNAEKYGDICKSAIPIYNQEIMCVSDQYTDLGKVPWDQLSEDSQKYLYGRFSSMLRAVDLAISGYYVEKGAIIP